MWPDAKRSILVLLALTFLTGVIYPLAVTGAAWLLFPHRAAGSLLFRDGTAVGSSLIGQPFDAPAYFWGRPSATPSSPYNGASSSGSNIGPTNPAQSDAVRARVDMLQAADPGGTTPIPIDLVTASGSGLDPDISVAAADYQVSRVARARGMTPATVRRFVAAATRARTLGVLGEPRVNVLELNLALDRASGVGPPLSIRLPLD